MDIAFLIVIVLQFAYIIFKDVLGSKERDRLQLKLMSGGAREYVDTIAPEAENSKDTVDIHEYVSVFEGGVRQDDILHAEDMS